MELSDIIYKTQEAMRVLPSKTGGLSLLVSTAESKETGNSLYNLVTANEDKYKGIYGRIRLWEDKILPYVYNLPIMEMVKAGYFKMETRNDFFGSHVKIYDKKTGKLKLKIKAPWLTAVLSYLFGSFVKSRTYVSKDKTNYQKAA